VHKKSWSSLFKIRAEFSDIKQNKIM